MATEQRGEPGPPRVHPSSVVGPEVELGAGVEVGPFCLLDGRISIGPLTRLLGHVTVRGSTRLGSGNLLHPNVVIGGEPQDLTYIGALREVRIGDRNIFREGVTVNRGSQRGQVTIVGDDNYLMQNAHVAHDCRVGNGTIIAGGALLAGWVEVGDGALVSGNCVVHQFVRIGRLALMRGGSRASRDIPPFCVADGTHTVRGINVMGLRRAGVAREGIAALRRAFTELFGVRRNLRLAVERMLGGGELAPEVRELIEFIQASKRGVAFGPRRQGLTETED